MMPMVVILLLILVNGVFVMAEMALVSSRKPRLQQWANEGSTGAQTALELSSNPDRFLATTQVGITVISILTGAYGERALTSQLAKRLDEYPSIAPYSETLAFAIVVALIAYVSLVVGELVPKRVGLHNPERIASAMAKPMNFFSRLGAPIVRLLGGSTRIVLRTFSLRPSDEPPVTEEEIKEIGRASCRERV